MTIYDLHLTPLLERCTNEELAPLVDLLSEPITSGLGRHVDVQRFGPDHRRYIHAIVRELRLFGGHSISDRFSQPGGRAYQEVVTAALKELGLRVEVHGSLEEMERRVATLLLDADFDRRDAPEQQEMLHSFWRGDLFHRGKIPPRSAMDAYLERDVHLKRRLSLRKIGRTVSARTRGYIRGKIRQRLVKLVLKTALKRAAAPVAFGLSVWGALGPAWRVTLPAIMYIAYLRHLKGMDAHVQNSPAK